MGVAVILTLLVGFHVVKVWHFLTCSFIVGFAQAFGGPAYSALIPTLVPKEDMPNAIALNSIQFNAAVMVGPALAGWRCHVPGGHLVLRTERALVSGAGDRAADAQGPFSARENRGSILTSLKEGIAFVRDQGAMEGLIVLAFCMAALGVPMRTFLPVFADKVFHRGAGTAATFVSVSGAGSVVGALAVAGLGNVKNKGRVALIMLMLLGIGVTGFALSPSVPLSCADAVLRRRRHDGGVRHGELAGATDRHQPDARPRDERLQSLVPQRHAHGKPDRRMARPHFYGARGAGRERRASGLAGALLFSDAAPCRRALI